MFEFITHVHPNLFDMGFGTRGAGDQLLPDVATLLTEHKIGGLVEDPEHEFFFVGFGFVESHNSTLGEIMKKGKSKNIGVI
jgi:hypothetical protein